MPGKFVPGHFQDTANSSRVTSTDLTGRISGIKYTLRSTVLVI